MSAPVHRQLGRSACTALSGRIYPVSVCNLRPESIGTCHITTSDSGHPPRYALKLPHQLPINDKRVASHLSSRRARSLTAEGRCSLCPQEVALPGSAYRHRRRTAGPKAGDIAQRFSIGGHLAKMGQERSPWFGKIDLRVHECARLRVIRLRR